MAVVSTWGAPLRCPIHPGQHPALKRTHSFSWAALTGDPEGVISSNLPILSTAQQQGPADQLRPPNPGLISGIQARDELTTWGPGCPKARTGAAGGKARTTQPHSKGLQRCLHDCEPQLPHEKLEGKLNHVHV